MQQNHVRAFGCFRKLPWDSQQLRMPAARIDYLLAAGSYNEQRSLKEMLLDELLVEAQNLGVWHMSARVDASDLSSLHVLEEAGFLTVGGILTFALDLKAHSAVEPVNDFKIRLATADDGRRQRPWRARLTFTTASMPILSSIANWPMNFTQIGRAIHATVRLPTQC